MESDHNNTFSMIGYASKSYSSDNHKLDDIFKHQTDWFKHIKDQVYTNILLIDFLIIFSAQQ